MVVLQPKDIDVVSFINYDDFIKKPRIINDFSLHGQKKYQVDAHFAPTASWRHRFFDKAQQAEAYWLDIFGSSRSDENLIQHPKGIIKIQF